MGDARSATTTILFTDLVDSTVLLERAGDDAAQRIFRAHHQLLSDAVARHGGHEVKWLGDGLMVAFPSAAEAARCAIAMQQAARRPAAGERLLIRVGLNAGEALRDPGDYFGLTVVVARRLCDSAAVGEILVSDLTAQLLRSHGEFAFEDRGEQRLKGISDPVRVRELTYQHDPIAMLTVTPFVGRGDEMAALSARLYVATRGEGGVAMLVGEPGIGKTRTIEEFSSEARSRGARVLGGRCYDGEWAPPFSPFIEALRDYVREAPEAELRTALGADAGVLARIMPAVRERLPDVEEPPALQSEGERYRLLEAVSDVLVRIAAERPLVLVLDDLQWADKGTIAMLRYAARAASSRRIVLLGAYRDVELDRQHPLAAALADFRRETSFERIALKGLAVDDIGTLLDVVAEQDVARPLVEAIAAETNGNPFFIREVMLHLIEERKIVREDGRWTSTLSIAEMGIPEGVKEVIGRRLSRLSDRCNEMLTSASAMTGGFTWGELEAIAGGEVPPDAGPHPAPGTRPRAPTATGAPLLGALEEGLRAQMLVETARGTYDFVHALIRHTLYGELSTPRRVLLHRRIGEALERLYAPDIEAHVPELAYHFSEAAMTDKGVDYCRRAALRAVGLTAYDDAMAFVDRALALNNDPRTRCELLLLLGRMQFYNGIIDVRNIDTFVAAGEVARQIGDRHLLARAATCEGRPWTATDSRVKPLLKEALDLLGDEESGLRAITMAMYAGHAAFELGMDCLRISDEAAALANRCGDSRAEALTHLYRFLIRDWVSSYLDATMDSNEAARDVLRAAEACGDADLIRAARFQCWGSSMNTGNLVEADEHLGEYAALSDASKIPGEMWTTEAALAARAVHIGHFHEAEERIQGARRFEILFPLMAYGSFVQRSILLLVLQGRTDDALALLDGAESERLEWGHLYQATLRLLILTAANRVADTQLTLDSLPRPVQASDRVNYRILEMVTFADAYALLDDRERAKRLHARMLPWAHRNAIFGPHIFLGSTDRQLGVLATTIGQFDDAERHFEDAVAMNTRMGARPWVARTQLDYARMLLRRGGDGDGRRARGLLDAALATAREIGMAGAAADCEGLLAVSG